MNYLGNHSWEAFFYGNTCQKIEDESLKPEVSKRKNISFGRIPIRVKKEFIGGTYPVYIGGPFFFIGGSQRISGEKISKTIDWSQSIKELRDFFGISQEDLANISKISLGTIKNIEGKANRTPSDKVRERLKLILELKNFLIYALDNKKYSIRSLLNSKLSALGGEETIMQFLSSGDESSIYDLLGVLRRIY